MNNSKKFSLVASFRFGFYTLIEHFAFYLGLMFSYLGIMLVGSILVLSIVFFPYSNRIIELVNILESAGVQRTEMVINVARQLGPAFGIVIVLAFIVLYFLNRYLVLGFTKIALNFYDKKSNQFKTLFSQYNLIVKDAVATFLYWLMCFFGVLFFVVPGIYLSITFGFYHLFIVDENVGIFESFKKSAALTYGAKWQLFALTVLLSLLYYVISIIFGLLLMLIWTLISLIYAYVYRKLQQR
jgi:uncharacterized membrane protein